MGSIHGQQTKIPHDLWHGQFNEKSSKAIKEEVTLVRFMKEHIAHDNG